MLRKRCGGAKPQRTKRWHRSVQSAPEVATDWVYGSVIEKQIRIDLPAPSSGDIFETEFVGPINYLVGPNGSGKSRFAERLLTGFTRSSLKARLLGADRLREMAILGRRGPSLFSGRLRSCIGKDDPIGSPAVPDDRFLPSVESGLPTVPCRSKSPTRALSN